MSGYIGTQPVPQATQTRQTFVATAAQTSFATGGYSVGYLDVFLNGVKLQDGVDYTATNGSDIVLTVGAALDDTLEVVAYTAFEVLDQTFTGTTTVDTLAVTGAATLANLTVNAANSTFNGAVGITSAAGAGITEGLLIDYSTNLARFLTYDSSTGSEIAMYTQPSGGSTTERLRVNSNGAVIVGPAAAGSAGAGDIVANGGIFLGGSAAANKLDDYEEGTFTPVLYGHSVDPSVTYTIRAGSYTKIGNTVTVLVDVRWSAQSGGSGVATIGGLPFSSVASYSYCAVGEKSSSWNYSTFTQYTVSIINNNRARVLVSGNGLGSLEFPITSLGTGNGYILFSLTYKTHA